MTGITQWASQVGDGLWSTYNYFFGASPLEQAISRGDKEAVQKLLKLEEKLPKSELREGKNLHCYIRCLNEDTPPDIEILNLLLNSVSNVNVEEQGSSYTALEHALVHMNNYKQMHWSVIECLFKRSINIRNDAKSTSAFGRLRDSQNHIINIRLFHETFCPLPI